MGQPRAALAALFIALTAAAQSQPVAEQGVHALLDARCEVVGISDGDTFSARCPYEQIRIRFAGIDAPESGQAFGQVSKQYLSQLIYRQQVQVVQTKPSRSYNRIVANVYDAEGKDVGLLMVSAGLAWHYKRFQREQTFAARSAYAQAEKQARKQKLGLWIDPHAQAPWDWRSPTRRQSVIDPLAGERRKVPTTVPFPTSNELPATRPTVRPSQHRRQDFNTLSNLARLLTERWRADPHKMNGQCE